MLAGWMDSGALPQEVPHAGIGTDHEVVLSRFEWTYKDRIERKELEYFVGSVLCQMAALLPLNSSASFTGRTCHYPKLNQLVLLWMTAFKHNNRPLLLDPPATAHAVEQAAAFLRQKSVEAVKDSSNNITD